MLHAFWRYERALMANDLAVLDELFLDGPDTIRGDAAGILRGHDAISAFRQGRGGAPGREIVTVEVVPIDADAALVVAITAPLTGGRGQQSQLWINTDAGWRVRAAHVSLPAPAITTSVWRTVGSPLVAGSPEGPLAGKTVAVKDLYALAGHPIGGGVPAFLAEAAPERTTAPAVQALLDAGASVRGIAQTDEFAYSIAGRNPHYGTPPNPAVVGGIPGGSSSGPASAVAQGQADIGLSTDTGGSIRVPASYCGLWGLRTTHGAVSREGLLPLAESFDTAGWVTRDASTLRAAAAASLPESDQLVTLGASNGPKDSTRATFVVDPALLAHVEPEVRIAFEATAPAAETVQLPDVDELFETFRTVQAAEAWRAHGGWIDAHPGALGDDIGARFAWASTITADHEAWARAKHRALRSELDDLLGDRVLLLPSASSVAPQATADAATIERTRAGTLRLTCIAGLTGRPGLSVPVLTVPRTAALVPEPVGLCLVGPRGSDLALIDLAVATFG